MPTIEELSQLTAQEILDLQDRAETLGELNAISDIGEQVLKQRLNEAVGDFRKNTTKFIRVTQRIRGHIIAIRESHPGTTTPALDSLEARFGLICQELHDRDALRKTFAIGDEPSVRNDEEDINPAPALIPLAPGARPELHLTAPTPINSKAFEHLADEYVSYFLRAEIRDARASTVEDLAEQALGFKPTYDLVGDELGIPWWFIAGIHLLESTFNFTTHLHNGDPLQQRTVREPPNRPAAGSPPFTWEESARDALERQELANLKDWSLPRALWRWERYNGFGYRSRGVPTPYLWSFSTIYESGKFVRDGEFSEGAVSQQCGAAVLLKALHEKEKVPDLGLDLVAEDETDQPDANADIRPVVSRHQPNIDNNVPSGNTFERFFNQNLPDIQHFEWHEFLIKGSSNARHQLNTDPPPELWPNVIALARVLESFRNAIGEQVILTSVYRSPAYNAAIGGSNRSQHMAFTAADFQVSVGGNTGDWADILKRLRQQGAFEGGIGIYRSFVHVDTRGSRADWDKR